MRYIYHELKGKMMTIPKLKALGVVLALLLYVYLLFFIKTFYMKSKKLDHTLKMAMETENKLLNLHKLDQTLASQIARVNKLYEEYY